VQHLALIEPLLAEASEAEAREARALLGQLASRQRAVHERMAAELQMPQPAMPAQRWRPMPGLSIRAKATAIAQSSSSPRGRPARP